MHLRDHLEEQVAQLAVPVLALRARRDRLSTDAWMQDLAAVNDSVEWIGVPGAHAFVWTHPDAWSNPLQNLADRAAGRS